jgi:LemA protein
MTWIRKTGLALALALVAMGSSGCSYNTFVSQEESIKAQWGQVENQLQRRNDLIPNLVETVKGVAQQEQDVFGRIAD